jgi:hypothetical protein
MIMKLAMCCSRRRTSFSCQVAGHDPMIPSETETDFSLGLPGGGLPFNDYYYRS